MNRTPILLFAALMGCASTEATTDGAPRTVSAPKPAPAPKVAEAPKAPAAGEGGAAADLANGKKVYDQYCQACHQADGTGMNGMLGADFVNDPTRLAKSDEELLKAIDQGMTGKLGTMPPWKGTVSPQEQVDVLAYIRGTFAKP